MTAAARVLVLGAGSAGARHAATLTRAGASVAVSDPDESRAKAIAADAVPFDLDRLDGYDGIVVASPSVFHGEQALAALATSAHVLVEKPLSTSTEALDDLVRLGEGRVMVGFNLRLHAPVQRVIALLADGVGGRLAAVRVWFGHWLPDWRPSVDYRTTYSAQAALGGGILDDASHELDLLVWLLGEQLDVVGAVVDRRGPLEMDVEDTVMALLRGSDGTVAELSLDYLSRRYRRGIEAIGDRATVRLDWARGVIEVESGSDVETEPAGTSVAESYERQAERFLAFLAGSADAPVGPAAGAASVRLAERIRAAAR
ncbi:MAG: putative dehydrogenase [Acidimicrobiales bacterium]|nr:putative dehydrogenase [Acidimicrobiales bacterium]